MLYGVDVSGHQCNDGHDPPYWKPSGEEKFVGVKVTEGRTYVSSHRVHQIDDVRKKGGIPVLHYHFLWPGDPLQQAAYFVSQLYDLQPGDLLACDWEETKDGMATVADVANFIAEVKRLRPNHLCGLYTFKDAWLNTKVKKGDFLWVAYYTDKADPGVTGWDFWQYSRSNNLDKDRARFTTAEQLHEFTLPGQQPPPGLRWSQTYDSSYLEFGGSAKWATPLDREIWIACALEAGWGSVRIIQGGLRPHTSFSGSTHMGLGVADIAIDGHSKDEVWELCATGRRSGMRPFPRGYGGDPWENNKHIHYASRESYDHAHKTLQDQVKAQEKGRNGLAKDGPYNGPTYAKLGRWADSPYNPVNVRLEPGKYVVDPAKVSTVLAGKTVDDKVLRKRAPGYELEAVKLVKRWGQWHAVTKTPTYYALDYLKET